LRIDSDQAGGTGNLSTKKHLSIILVLGIYLFFLGNQGIFITDPVESNYALTASEMVQSGNYISPQIYGTYWYDKPIFFYWQLASAFQMFGTNEFAARFWPAVMGILGLFMTYAFTKKLYDAKIGFFTALILGTSFEYWLISKTVITDMSLFVFFNAVLICFYLAYSSEKKQYYYGAYLFAGLATLTKGPIGFLLPGLIIVVFMLWRRNFAELKHMKLLSGSLILLLVGGSWYYIMYKIHGTIFLETFLGIHNFLRATVSEHPKDNVWYFYLAMFFIGFFPWAFIMPLAVKKIWQQRKWPNIDEKTGFLLIWIFVVFAFYQIVATKYTTYTFPYLLPIAILAARFLAERRNFIVKVVAFNIIFYTVLTFWVAIPYCQQFSAKTAAVIVASAKDTETIVGSYGDYHTSAVFYSRTQVYRMEKAKDIDNMLPKAMSWSSKNVMPFLAEENLADKKNVLMLVDDDSLERFKKDMPGDWLLIGQANQEFLFRKQ